MKAADRQPVVVLVDAILDDLINLKGARSTEDSMVQKINHAITIVGYGVEEDQTKYWLIKNAWGRYGGIKD